MQTSTAQSDFGELQQSVDRLDKRIAGWMRRNGPLLARVALAIVFIWFGLLKPLGKSSASELATRTVYWVDPAWFIPLLGWWEVAIGVFMLIRPLLRLGILLLLLQMPGTFLPPVLLPNVCFVSVPFVPTLEGQYIIKNLVLIAAAIVVGGTVREKPTGLTARTRD
ncbi:MAG: hypothetical protein Q7R41_14850 [Phycisphaerales bacterium]|nr:hypothetical protein [Phycisphaerales bacterium]